MIDLKNSKNQDKILLVKIMQIDEQAVKTQIRQIKSDNKVKINLPAADNCELKC